MYRLLRSKYGRKLLQYSNSNNLSKARLSIKYCVVYDLMSSSLPWNLRKISYPFLDINRNLPSILHPIEPAFKLNHTEYKI